MPRSAPGQLSLFDDFPAALFATSMPAGPVRPEPQPDRLLLSLLVGGKAAGALIGAGEALADRHGLAAPSFIDLFHLPVFDLGEADDLGEPEAAALLTAAEKATLPRFTIAAKQIGPVEMRERPAAALMVEEDAALDGFAEQLFAALSERGLGDYLNRTSEPAILLGGTAEMVPEARLARPLDLPLREFGLVRINGDTQVPQVVQKWSLRP